MEAITIVDIDYLVLVNKNNKLPKKNIKWINNQKSWK